MRCQLLPQGINKSPEYPKKCSLYSQYPILSSERKFISILLIFVFLIGIRSRLNNHYKAWSYMKKKHKKIKAYMKSLKKEPTVNRCLLILDLKPFRL